MLACPMRSTLRAPFLMTLASVGATSLAGCGSSGTSSGGSGPPMNPPMPAPITACPPTAPAVGDPCTGELQCHYGSDDGCDPSYVDYRCVSGNIDLAPRPTCNPPEPPPPVPPGPPIPPSKP